MNYTTEHYAALMTRLSNEKNYLSRAVGEEAVSMRKVWITQIEKEIGGEIEFLKSKGVSVYTSNTEVDQLSDDELMEELLG